MKRASFLLLLIICETPVFSQTAERFLQTGIQKHNKKLYEEALLAYTSAIEADNKLTAAYFNRGTVYLALERLEEAIEDFDVTLELDNNFIRAYYSRANVYIQMERYQEALSDLNKVIERDEKFPNALLLRGQVKCAEDNRKGGCEDFLRAKTLGDPGGERMLKKYCEDQELQEELLHLNWPADESWRTGNRQENEEMILVEYLKRGETFDDWTELGTMQTIKGVTGIPVSKTMNMMYEQSRQSCPNAQLTFIEKGETGAHPWIIFTIECASFKESEQPESQVWYIVQGDSALYTNFWAVREKTIPITLRKKWTEFFKTGKIVYSGQ